MHMYGGNSLITALDRIDQKAPKINEVPQKGDFLYNKEPQIVDITWMNEDMSEEIFSYCPGDTISLLVKTRNYCTNDPVSIFVEVEDSENENKVIKLDGFVEDDGFVRLVKKLILACINTYKMTILIIYRSILNVYLWN